MKNIIIILFFVPFLLKSQDAFISGNIFLCSNEGNDEVQVSFNGIAPYTFVYSINGTNQSSITTFLNPYIIPSLQEGVYSLVSYSDAVSVGTISGNAMLTLYQAPTAIILTITDTINTLDPSLQFTSNSEGNITEQNWNYGDNSPSEITNNPIHTFPLNPDGLGIASTYQISLIVTDDNNCKDTTYKNIFVVNEYWIYFPNSFTPDNDNVNDKFCIEYSGIRENTFSFYVLNRNGEVLFETNDSKSLKCSENGGWDGKDSDGNDIIPGTYAYELYFQEWDGWKNTKHGTINLIR
ncbi:MAG: T9SS type B sorting domain-containing protein [Flavobacteriales bacterium]